MSSESSLFSDLSDSVYISSDTEKLVTMKIPSDTSDITEPIVPDIYVERLLQDNGHVSLAYSDFKAMPRNVPRILGTVVQVLDLSHNKFRNLGFLAHFPKLHTLVLDHNFEMQLTTFPSVSTLKILWLNNCKITNLDEWVNMLSVNCPELEHLSLMCNPSGSPILNGKGEEDEENYRKTVGKVLTKLKTLDGRSLEDTCTLSAWDSCSDLVEKVKTC